MRQRVVNGRWNLWVPDNVADWDAPSGDYSARRGWEFERFESFRRELRWGDTFYDIGAEHGWISAIIAREFVGASNMVLFEPSPEFWVNIRKTWQYNGLDDPAACWAGFVNEGTDEGWNGDFGWPSFADASKPEVPGMAYRSLVDPRVIPSVTVDAFAATSVLWPNALNIDVEGAELLVLRGAREELMSGEGTLRNVWVSVHPDLMEKYDHAPEMLHDFMHDCGWVGEHLGTDHEEHHHWIRR